MTQLPPPASHPTVRPQYWRPTEGLRTALTWLLAVDGVGALATAVAHLHRSVAIGDYRRGGATLSQLRTADDAVKTLNGLTTLVFLATAIVFVLRGSTKMTRVSGSGSLGNRCLRLSAVPPCRLGIQCARK